MTKRSGYNKAIDVPLLKDVPSYLADDLVDKSRNTLVKMSSNSKFIGRKKDSIA